MSYNFGGVYMVQKGDTLSKIAKRYSVEWQELARVNAATIPNPDLIYPGQQVIVPPYPQGTPQSGAAGPVDPARDAAAAQLIASGNREAIAEVQDKIARGQLSLTADTGPGWGPLARQAWAARSSSPAASGDSSSSGGGSLVLLALLAAAAIFS